MREPDLWGTIKSLEVGKVHRRTDNSLLIETEVAYLEDLVKIFHKRGTSKLLEIAYDNHMNVIFYVFLFQEKDSPRLVYVKVSYDGDKKKEIPHSISMYHSFAEILERKEMLRHDVSFAKAHYSYVLSDEPEINEDSLVHHYSLVLMTDNGTIERANLHLGIPHLKLEVRITGKSWHYGLHYIGRYIPFCKFSHKLAYIHAMEKLQMVSPPPATSLLRVFLLELERIESHLLWLGMMAEAIGMSSFLKKAFDLRSKFLRIGSELEHDDQKMLVWACEQYFSDAETNVAKTKLESLAMEVNELLGNSHFQQLQNITKRIGGIGTEEAKSFDPVGPIARALGIPTDTRRISMEHYYKDLPLSIIVNKKNDLSGLIEVKAKEIQNSMKILDHVLEIWPNSEVEYEKKLPDWSPVKTLEPSISMVEAPGGMLTYHLVALEKDRLSSISIVPPTLRNFPVLLQRMVGEDIAHVALLLRTVEMTDLIKTIVIEDLARKKIASCPFNKLSEITKKEFEKRRKQ